MTVDQEPVDQEAEKALLERLAAHVQRHFPSGLEFSYDSDDFSDGFPDGSVLNIRPDDPDEVSVSVLAVAGTAGIFPGGAEALWSDEDPDIDSWPSYEDWAVEQLLQIGRFGAVTYKFRGIRGFFLGRSQLLPRSVAEVDELKRRNDIEILHLWQPWGHGA